MVDQLRLLEPDRSAHPDRSAGPDRSARPDRREAKSRYRELRGAGGDPWSLDERTCSVGMRGIEAARRALAEAVARASAA